MKTSFKTRVSRMGLREYQYFCHEMLFFSLFIFSIFSNLINQNLQNVDTPERKLGSFVQRYSFKFRAHVENFHPS